MEVAALFGEENMVLRNADFIMFYICSLIPVELRLVFDVVGVISNLMDAVVPRVASCI